MSSLLKEVNARKIKKKRWVIFAKKWGKKLGGCSRQGGLKNKKFKKPALAGSP